MRFLMEAQTLRYTDNLEDEAPVGAKVSYFIEAVEGIANKYLVRETSNSNEVAVYLEGRLFIPNAFAPNGHNRSWKPVTHFISKADYKVQVFNRWGQTVFEATNHEEAWDGAGCTADVYVYQVMYKNSRGEFKQVNGTINLLR
jgi:gliding motility-associated-like protein